MRKHFVMMRSDCDAMAMMTVTPEQIESLTKGETDSTMQPMEISDNDMNPDPADLQLRIRMLELKFDRLEIVTWQTVKNALQKRLSKLLRMKSGRRTQKSA